MRKKKFIYGFIGFIVASTAALAVGYLILTSSAFLKKIVLPAVGKALGCEIKADEIDISPLHSQITVSNLLVGKPDQPFLTVKSVSCRYQLFKILKNNITVDNLNVEGINVRLLRNADGNWEVPFPASGGKEADKTTAAAPQTKTMTSAPLLFNLKDINVKGLNLKLEINHPNTIPARLELNDIDISVPSFANGTDNKIKLSGDIRVNSGNNVSVTAGKFAADANILLPTSGQIPEKANLLVQFSGLRGKINTMPLDGNGLTLVLNASGKENGITINNLIIRQLYRDSVRTNVQLKANVDFTPFKATAQFKLSPVSEEIMSLLCEFGCGYNPGQVRLYYTGAADYSNNVINSSGQLELTRQGTAIIGGKPLLLPDFILKTDHNLSVNLQKSEASVNILNAALFRDKQSIADLTMLRPAAVSWANGQVRSIGAPPQLNLRIKNLELGNFVPFLNLPDTIKLQSGNLNADIRVQVEGQAKNIGVAGDCTIDNLNLRTKAVALENAKLTQKVDIRLEAMTELQVKNFSLMASNRRESLVSLTGNGYFNMASREGKLNLLIDGISNRTPAALPLSADQIKPLADAVAGLDPFKISLPLSINFNFKNQTADINTAAFRLYQNGYAAIEIKADPIFLNFKQDIKPPPLNLKLTARQLPLKQLNHFLRGSGTSIAGKVDMETVVTIANNFKNISCKGNITLNALDIYTAEKSYRNLNLQQSLDLKLDNFCALQLNPMNMALTVNQLPALKLSAAGRIDLNNGSGSLNICIFTLNQHLFNLISPGNVNLLEVTGENSLRWNNNFNTITVIGNLNIAQLRTPQIQSAINGNIAFNLTRKPDYLKCSGTSVKLMQGNRPAIQIDLDALLPESNDKSEPLTINLSSKKIDLAIIEQLFAQKESAAKPAVKSRQAAKAKGITFDLGQRQIITNLNLQGITYGPTIGATVKSIIVGQGKTINANPLVITLNETVMNFTVNLKSGSADTAFAVQGNFDKLPLPPLMHAFAAGEMRQFEGNIDSFAVNVKSAGLSAPLLWDSLTGSATATCSGITIPNSVENTTFGKIIFIPFKMLAHIDKIMPNSQQQQKTADAFDFVNNVFNEKAKITFKTGKTSLVFKDGRINIKEFELRGDFIQKLTFNGSLGLGSYRKLNIDSQLVVGQICLPVVIIGTVDSPSADITKTVEGFIKTNTLNILDPNNLKKIVKSSNQGLQGVVNETLNIISSGQSSETSGTSNTSDTSGTQTKKDQVKNIEQNVRQIINIFSR